MGLELQACIGLLWGLNCTLLGKKKKKKTTSQDLELPGSDRPARLGLWRQRTAQANGCKWGVSVFVNFSLGVGAQILMNFYPLNSKYCWGPLRVLAPLSSTPVTRTVTEKSFLIEQNGFYPLHGFRHKRKIP